MTGLPRARTSSFFAPPRQPEDGSFECNLKFVRPESFARRAKMTSQSGDFEKNRLDSILDNTVDLFHFDIHISRISFDIVEVLVKNYYQNLINLFTVFNNILTIYNN